MPTILIIDDNSVELFQLGFSRRILFAWPVLIDTALGFL